MLDYTLNLVNSTTNYGIEIYGSTFDPVFSKSNLNSSPTVSIIGASCFIDYSDCFDNSDRTTLIKLFKNTPVGTTFSFSEANYFDEEKSILRDVSGIFSLSSLTNNDKLLIGNIVSGFTYSSSYNLYHKNNFVNSPQYSTSYSGSTGNNYILNNLNDQKYKSFNNKGIIGSIFGKQEYIEIVGSTSNSGKMPVNSSLVLKDKKELIYCDQNLSNENLTIQNTTLNQYIRGNSNPEIISKNKNSLGAYLIYNSSGNQIDCFGKQNEIQGFLRSFLEGSTYSTQWVLCDSCDSIASTTHNANVSDKTYFFDVLLMLQVSETSNSLGQPITSLYANYPTSYILNPLNSINIAPNYGFKIDLSHPSLKGYSVSIFIDENKNVPLTENYYKYGTPGYDQSSILCLVGLSSPKKFYIELYGKTTLSLTVSVL
jgi:hypothetical protein